MSAAEPRPRFWDGWRRAYDERAELAAYYDSPQGRASVAAFARSAYQGSAASADSEIALPILIADLTRAGDVWAVHPEMEDLLLSAGPQMPPQPLEEGDLPAPAGVVFLPSPVAVRDVRGQRMAFRAFAWQHLPASGALIIAYFTDTRTPGEDDYITQLTPLELAVCPTWLLMHSMLWRLGTSWTADADPESEGTIKKYAAQGIDARDGMASVEYCRQIMMAFFTLVGQPITVLDDEAPPRAARRRQERTNPAAPSRIKVVTLRRPRREGSSGETETHRGYSHRFPVSGHWRNQPCGPRREQRRLQWIPSFVKGDPDLPLVLKEKVYRWMR